MEQENIYFTLKEIGLNEREIRLYLAALKTGEAGMSDLARIAGLKRTSAYLVFENLEAKGFLGSFETRRGKRFVARDPANLLEKARKEMQAIQDILPELKALTFHNQDSPRITYYEGQDDYQRVVEECLQFPNTTVRHIGCLSKGLEVMGKDYDHKHFAPERIKNKIYLKAIYEKEVAGLFKNDTPEKLRDIKYFPSPSHIKTLTLIHQNRVIVTTSKENLGIIVIESEEIAKAEREKFDLIWNGLK